MDDLATEAPVSDSTAPSSPHPISDAIFSDTLVRSSTPPSSPPAFTWDIRYSLNKSAPKSVDIVQPSAFSVLGKRKALTPLGLNTIRPAKKPLPESGLKKPLTQLHIDLGQRTRHTCAECGMEFVPSLIEDTRLHDAYHRVRVAGCAVGATFVGHTRPAQRFAGVQNDDVIVRIDRHDRASRRKLAETVLETVQKELGAVPIEVGELWDDIERFRAYLYVREKRVVGFLLTEKIKRAFLVTGTEQKRGRDVAERTRVMSKDGRTHHGIERQTSALEALRARKRAAAEASENLDKRPLTLSEKQASVQLGVSRIWTLQACRGAKIATSLLDAATQDENIANKLQVAFSQPTQAGARLARKWMGLTFGWHVYS